MSRIDLSILKSAPHLTVNAELVIEPLAPLSMVSELPGSFYKSMKSPSKKMVCGLIENVLGWHIDWKDRKVIQDEVKKMRQKQKCKFTTFAYGSTYIPLLMDYFNVTGDIRINFSEICFIDDLWSRSYRRADSNKHINGCRYMDISMVQKWEKIKNAVDKDEKRTSKEKNVLLDKLFTRYIGKFPKYYSTPTIREYIDLRGRYVIPLLMDVKLFDSLNNEINMNNIGYLGNSEDWINLKIKKL